MASGKSIDSLSDELLLEIFSYFTTEELAMTIQHVNCRWKEVSQDNSLWKNRTYSPGNTTTDDELVQHLRNMPKLKKFLPKREIKSRRIINTMSNNCRNIQHFEFWEFQIVTVPTLKQIHRAFPDLTFLEVPLSKLVDPFKLSKIIGQFKNLTTLGFASTHHRVETNILSVLAEECPRLQHIDLGHCKFVDEDLRYFLEKKRNEILSFSVRCYISSETYVALSDCKNLEHLVYKNYNHNLPDPSMSLFSKLSKMKSLSLGLYKGRQTRNLCNMFTNNAFPYLVTLDISWCFNFEPEILNKILRNCPGLKELKIFDNSEIDEGFASIGTCSRLEKLTLLCMLISDRSFQYIGSGCHELKNLFIDGSTYLTDKAFEYICIGCPQLEQLEVSNSVEITDTMIEHLFKCRNLRSLSISNNLKIRGVHFVNIPIYLRNLKKFYIWRCEKIKKENFEKLQAKMPHLKLKYDGNSENEGSNFDTDQSIYGTDRSNFDTDLESIISSD